MRRRVPRERYSHESGVSAPPPPFDRLTFDARGDLMMGRGGSAQTTSSRTRCHARGRLGCWRWARMRTWRCSSTRQARERRRRRSRATWWLALREGWTACCCSTAKNSVWRSWRARSRASGRSATKPVRTPYAPVVPLGRPTFPLRRVVDSFTQQRHGFIWGIWCSFFPSRYVACTVPTVG